MAIMHEGTPLMHRTTQWEGPMWHHDYTGNSESLALSDSCSGVHGVSWQ